MTMGEVLRKSGESVLIDPNATYREVTIKLWGKGVVLRREASGSEIAAPRRSVVREGQFILSRIDARNGAFGIVPPALDGAVVSNDFPSFNLNTQRIIPEYLKWLSRSADFVDLCKAASEGTTNRVRLKENKFLGTAIGLPPLEEQRRIVARIEDLAAKIEEALCLRKRIETVTYSLLAAAYHRIADSAPRKAMAEVAPLNRRPVNVDIEKNYPQVSVRSFGRGSFHNPPLAGSEITWQKPFLVKSGDILISNIKAWEGALAVALPEDDGRVASHRYLTCVPIPGIATPRFVCFHLLTPEGLHYIGEASPGSADRNRTLSTKALLRIPIPVPSFEQQHWFDGLCRKVDSLKRLHTETSSEMDAMLPSILDKAFKGKL
jgi:type I restriction enzyme S subunit